MVCYEILIWAAAEAFGTDLDWPAGTPREYFTVVYCGGTLRWEPTNQENCGYYMCGYE